MTAARFILRFIVVSLVFAACDASSAHKNAPSSSANSSSTPTSVPQTAASAKGEVADTALLYIDSAQVFAPDGYYFVKEQTRIGEGKVGWLELHTIDYYYGGKLHYERPKLVQPPEVVLAITIPGSSKHSMHPCTNALITPDSLSVRCIVSARSEVTINGHFLDKRGQYSDKLEYENRPTVLLVARVVVTEDGKVAHDALHHFTYSSGG